MVEDFNKLRLTAKRLVREEFKQSWQFRYEIEGQPSNFDLYVKEGTHGPTEIGNDPVKIGSRTLTYPVSAAPVTISLTIRDNAKEEMAQFFDKWAAQVVNADGTVNLPYGQDGYVRKVKRYAIQPDTSEIERETWEIIPVQRGDVTESREEGGFLEFPLTVIQFRS